MWITYHGLEYGAQKRREVIDTVLSREKLMDFNYYHEYLVNINEYIKQSIIMAVLRKANSDSVDICRLMKNQYCKRRSRRNSDLDFFFQAAKCLRTNVLPIIEPFLQERAQHKTSYRWKKCWNR